MKLSRAYTLDQVRSVIRYEESREALRGEQFAVHRAKPLGFWTRPGDRGLPLKLLGRKLGELIEMTYDDLIDVRGIGDKKFDSYLMLLARALAAGSEELGMLADGSSPAPMATTDGRHASTPARRGHRQADDHRGNPAAARVAGDGDGDGDGGNRRNDDQREGDSRAWRDSPPGFTTEEVSEWQWSRWRECVVRHGLQDATLGHLAPSLRGLSRSLWDTPLSEYTNRTLAQLRRRKSHNEKHLCSIVEVFRSIHALLCDAEPGGHLGLHLRPRLIGQAADWLSETQRKRTVPTKRECLDQFVMPLVEQLRRDVKQQAVAFAERRLGVSGGTTDGRPAARRDQPPRRGADRLLGEISAVLNVRWPGGQSQAHALLARLDRQVPSRGKRARLRQVQSVVELFGPTATGGSPATSTKP